MENKNIILEKELEKFKIELDTKCVENNEFKTKLREIRKEKKCHKERVANGKAGYESHPKPKSVRGRRFWTS